MGRSGPASVWSAGRPATPVLAGSRAPTPELNACPALPCPALPCPALPCPATRLPPADFLLYFEATAPLLDADPTLWCGAGRPGARLRGPQLPQPALAHPAKGCCTSPRCLASAHLPACPPRPPVPPSPSPVPPRRCVSTWNDNGFTTGHAWDVRRLFRTSYFPGGWGGWVGKQAGAVGGFSQPLDLKAAGATRMPDCRASRCSPQQRARCACSERRPDARCAAWRAQAWAG